MDGRGHIRQTALRQGGGRMVGICGTCVYNRFDDEYPMSGAFYCANRDGDYYGDYTEYDDGCDEWEDAWEGVG